MKIEKIKAFHRELLREFSPDGLACELHYHTNKNWINISNTSAVPMSTITYLDRSKGESISYHNANSLTAWFYILEADATISLSFPKSPQINTRRKIRKRIEKSYESASNAYKVSHHPLTHLLAKDAFREQLTLAIAEINGSTPSYIDAQESKHPRKLAVMALDIDYFKQVNDTWGHLYGDQVLKAFGKRLESTALKIQNEGTGAPIAYTGHPSGEEFLVLITANATREQFELWAEDFRSSIAEEILPTAKEWQWLNECDELSALSLPQTQDRTITASIGVALHTNTTPSDSTLDPAAVFLDRADTALYRAKAAGRNQAIFYDDILSSCGRVLEQDANTDVIAIDIGSNVGVTIGQEFKVYNPKFSGSRKFSVNDGRTTRTLGTYPRVESARIVVFNCQPEISFASIDSVDNVSTFLEPGSLLEAIPAGSIGHLLPHSSRYFPSSSTHFDAGGVQAIQDFLKADSKSTKPFAIVIRFTREPEYLRKYGTAALNKSLARLYRAAQTTFHSARGVEVLDRASICIAGSNKGYDEKIVSEFVDRLADDLPELGILAGIFCHDDLKLFAEKSIILDPSNAIELARFSASEFGREPHSKIRHFKPNTPGQVLNALREARTFEVAFADFERLVSLGVDSADILNLGGLISSNLGKKQTALELYLKASKKSPTTYIYKTNYGTAAYVTGEIESGLEVLNTLTDEEVEKCQTAHPYGYITYTALLALAETDNTQLFNSQRFHHMAPIALSLPEITESPYARDRISEALAASLPTA